MSAVVECRMTKKSRISLNWTGFSQYFWPANWWRSQFFVFAILHFTTNVGVHDTNKDSWRVLVCSYLSASPKPNVQSNSHSLRNPRQGRFWNDWKRIVQLSILHVHPKEVSLFCSPGESIIAKQKKIWPYMVKGKRFAASCVPTFPLSAGADFGEEESTQSEGVGAE